MQFISLLLSMFSHKKLQIKSLGKSTNAILKSKGRALEITDEAVIESKEIGS